MIKQDTALTNRLPFQSLRVAFFNFIFLLIPLTSKDALKSENKEIDKITKELYFK